MNQLVLCDDRGLNREARLTIGYTYRVSLFAHASRNSPAQMRATASYRYWDPLWQIGCFPTAAGPGRHLRLGKVQLWNP